MSKGMYRSGAVLLVIPLIVILPGIAIGMGVSPRVPQISIQGQEARLSPAMLGVGSVFMKIENSGNGDDNLLSARAGIPGSVAELHEVKDGRMAKTEKIPIPARSTVELKPKGLHIMIFKMPKDIKDGHEFALYLMFEKSGEKQVPLKFTRTSDSAHHHDH